MNIIYVSSACSNVKYNSLVEEKIIETIAILTVETLACTVNNVKNKFSTSLIDNIKKLGMCKME